MARVVAALGWAAVAVAGLASIGCHEYPACRKDADCRVDAGEVCVANLCQGCRTDAECLDDTPPGHDAWRCVEQRCGPANGRDPSVARGGEEGDPCVQRTDCYGGLTCLEGRCAPCSADAQCSPSTCTPETGRCGPEGACETDEQCAMDEICDGGMCVFSGALGHEDGGPCGLAAIYFPFDSDEITPAAQEQLRQVAPCMQQQERRVVLEAHADDRGTLEYNIMLTERRGAKVERFLVELGVPDERMRVLPKGSLEAVGQDESTRSRDRRVAFLWPDGPAPL